MDPQIWAMFKAQQATQTYMNSPSYPALEPQQATETHVTYSHPPNIGQLGISHNVQQTEDTSMEDTSMLCGS